MNFIYALFLIFLIISYALILFGFVYYSGSSGILNRMLGFLSLGVVFIHIIFFLTLMGQEFLLYDVIIPLWLTFLVSPLLILISLVIISTITNTIIKSRKTSKRTVESLKNVENKIQQKGLVKKDIYRKINHILIFVGMFILWYLSSYFVRQVTNTTEGMLPMDTNSIGLYLKILSPSTKISEVLFSLGWFYFVLFFFYYSFTLLSLINEFTRKSEIFSFPFSFLCNLFLCEEEKSTYGTYLYFALGQLFAALTCPPMVYFAILSISSIADLAASQIGIRFGKHKVEWNDLKSWEGSFAGCITAFSTTIFFLGIWWAIILSITVLIFDLITRKPLDIIDNLLFPIGIALLYVFIRHIFGFNYTTVLLSWF